MDRENEENVCGAALESEDVAEIKKEEMKKIQHNEETTIEIVDTDMIMAVEKNPQKYKYIFIFWILEIWK